MKTTSDDRSATSSPSVDELALPIDTKALYSRCMGNVALAMALVDELESSGSQQVATMLLEATAGNVAEVAEGAHALKGAAAIIGAQPISAKAAQVEAMAREGKTHDLQKLLRELDEEMNRCLSYIPKLRQHSQE